MNVDSEAQEIMATLPKMGWPVTWSKVPKPNAFVFIDPDGRLSVMPTKGGWLGASPNNVDGDLAPLL